MHILSRRIGRLPFVLVSILLYLSVPLYYAAWEYETVSSYVMEPTGLIMGLFAILGSGIPFCFGHQIGVLDSLEFTALALQRLPREQAAAHRPVPAAREPSDTRLPDGQGARGASGPPLCRPSAGGARSGAGHCPLV